MDGAVQQTPRSVAVQGVMDRIEELFTLRRPPPRRIAVRCGDEPAFVVDGAARRVDPDDGPSDVRIQATVGDLQRFLRGEMDPRQSMLFGQFKVEAGSPRDAVALGDFLTGCRIAEAMETTRPPPVPTRDLCRARADLREFGFCLVEGAVPPDHVVDLRTRLVEQAAAEMDAGIADQLPSSQRVWNLINKGETFRRLLDNPLIDDVVPGLLGEHFLMTSYSAAIAHPGDTAGLMQYDQIYVQPPVPDVIFGLSILWFLDDVTDANGGPRILAGSHKGRIAPAELGDWSHTVAAAGPAGTALVLDSRAWHATGRNIGDHKRHMAISYFTRSFMRTQENYALSILPEVFDKLSDRHKTMMGFRVTGTLGGVEGPVEGAFVSRPVKPVGELRPKAA